MHSLAHSANKPQGMKNNGQWQHFLAGRLQYFLDRLASIDEGESTLLDNTLVLYGSSNSNTHNNKNYPLILAGGKSMGLKHGQYLQYGDDIPLANLYLTMMKGLGVSSERFADSSGGLKDVLA